MSSLPRASAVAAVSVALCAAGAAPASAARSCGTAKRPFTDARPAVSITKGRIQCSTARGVMRAYWKRDVSAFTKTVRLRYAGIRWVCRPTVGGEVPNRWACRGGGPSRNRFRVTARE